MRTKSSRAGAGESLRTNCSHDEAARTNCSQDAADVDAALIFDAALAAAGITSKEAAALFSCSESLVNRMRSPNHRERVSFAQMLRLPPTFHVALHRVLNRKYGFGRAALARLIGAAEDLALVVGE